MVAGAQPVHQLTHQLGVRRSETAETQVNHFARALERRRQLERRVGCPYAGLEPVPGLAQWTRPRIVELVRIRIEVEERRLVHELHRRQRRAPLLDCETAEVEPEGGGGRGGFVA